jgi:hypothetical protein
MIVNADSSSIKTRTVMPTKMLLIRLIAVRPVFLSHQ